MNYLGVALTTEEEAVLATFQLVGAAMQKTGDALRQASVAKSIFTPIHLKQLQDQLASLTAFHNSMKSAVTFLHQKSKAGLWKMTLMKREGKVMPAIAGRGIM